MKKISLIALMLGLFFFSFFVTLKIADASPAGAQSYTAVSAHADHAANASYVGLKAQAASVFAGIFAGIMAITGGRATAAVIALAIFAELILLYPAVIIQLKQKKIHLFHKKLIDLYAQEKLDANEAREDLYKIYDVNESIHHRGGLLVGAQILIFFFTFWGLGFISKIPGAFCSPAGTSGACALAGRTGFALPMLAAFIYLLHSAIKIYYKSKEDYINSSQILTASLFAIAGSAVVYVFAGSFAAALSVYFIALIVFATVRYLFVEYSTASWGRKYVEENLALMLALARPHKNRFELFSREWNYLPIVRNINFNLLEEGLSMALGILLAMSFFGSFKEMDEKFYHSYFLNIVNTQEVMADFLN